MLVQWSEILIPIEPFRGNSSTVALSTLQYNEDIRLSHALSDTRVQLISQYLVATISLEIYLVLRCSCPALSSYTYSILALHDVIRDDNNYIVQ